jgi:hypothetical protein
LSNSLIGLSILSGDNSAINSISSVMASIPTKAASAAKANFTTPETSPPWNDPADTSSTYRQIEAIKQMRSIIDTLPDPDAGGIDDVETSFVTYKALDRLRILAEEAAKAGTSATERAVLEKTFAKGLDDLHAFLSDAPSDLLNLYFDQPRRKAESVGIPAENTSGKVVGTGVSATRAAPLAGVAGNETIQINMAKGSLSRTLTVDLSTIAQPPTLDGVATALNAAIGAEPLLDANGQPLLKADGTPISRFQSKFVVEKVDDQWTLSFQPAGIESIALDQVGAPDALMVVAGQSVTDMPDVAKLLRFDTAAGTPEATTLGRINGVDREATAQALADDKATNSNDSTADDTSVQTVAADTVVRAMVTDAQGFSYVVGTTAGDVGYSRSDGEDDLFLTKMDSEGKIVWQRTLGAAGSAQGAALSVAANGDVVVAGSALGFNGTTGDDTDILVARFGANGDETFSTTLGGLGNDSANAVTIGADGSIYVAGKTSTGGGDAFVARLNATGKVVDRTTLPDSGGNDVVNALATDASGNLLVLTRENGVAKLHRLDGGALSSELGAIDLGTADARAIAVSAGGEIAVAGTTSVALNGAQSGALSGGQDGFVARIDADLTSATTTYVGSDKDDQIDSVTFMGNAIYVGGRTTGAIDGALRGKVDGFIARVEADGTIGSTSQFGIASARTSAVYVAAATGGSGIMGALGLHRGTMNAADDTDLTARAGLRPGDSFKISIDGHDDREVLIDKGETLATLADKVRAITGAKATVSTPKVDGMATLRIEAKEGYTIELSAGPQDEDALVKLGIDPGKISIPKEPGPKDPKVLPGGSFGLQLSDTLTLANSAGAALALKTIKSALSMTQTAYRSLYWDSSKESLVNGNVTAQGSAHQQAQLAQYKAALARLTGASS